MKRKIFHQSGKICTSSIWDANWLTRRSRCRKTNFTKVENFPPKVENFRPLQNVPIHAILQKKFFFLQLFESGKFSTKVEKFPLCIFGLKFGKREGLVAEKKKSPKWKIFHQKWKNFHLCRMFQFMWFWNKNFFFGSGKFSTKVEKIPLYLFGMKLGVLVCPDEQKIFLPKWIISHQKWKSCSTPRASLVMNE